MKKKLSIVLFILLNILSYAQSQVYIDILGGNKGLTSEFSLWNRLIKPADGMSFPEANCIFWNTKQSIHSLLIITFCLIISSKILGLQPEHTHLPLIPSVQDLELGYLKENEKFLVYANVSSAVTKDPDAQVMLILGYLPEISENWRLVFRTELRTAISYDHGHEFSA